MTNKNKKRPTGYRAPPSSKDAPPARKGILDSLFAPRVPGSSSMPRIPSSLYRGLVTVDLLADDRGHHGPGRHG